MASLSDLIHGRKPNVVPFKATDPIKELYTLLTGEIKDWPQIQQLGDLYQANAIAQISNLFPEFRDVVAQGGKDAENLLASAEPLTQGLIPADVKQQVFSDAAFTSLGAGTLFGPMGRALTARDLGTTSLGLMSQGAQLLAQGGNSAQLWDQIAQGTMLPASTQLYDPSWFTQYEAQQEATREAHKQLAENIKAAPDPATVDRVNLAMGIIGAATGAGGLGGGLKATGAYQSEFGGLTGAPGAGGMGRPGTVAAAAPQTAGVNAGQSTLWQQLMGMFGGGNPAYTNVGGAGYGGYQSGWGQNPAGAMGAYDPSFNYGGMPISSLDMYGTPA